MKTSGSTPFLLLILFVFLQACSNEKSTSAVQAEEGYRTINGTEIYYKKVGEGEPVIIVHGGPVLDHGYLVPYFQPLTQNYELIYYDQRLSGRSSADVDSADITLDNFIEDIEGLRQEFNLGKIHLMGHSWGGLLAMKYAIKYQSNLNSLILLNSVPASSEMRDQESEEISDRMTEEAQQERQKILSSELFQNDPAKAIEKLIITSYRHQFNDPFLADSLHFYIPDDYMQRGQKFQRMMPELANYNLHSELKNIQIPTLLIYGENEPASSLSGSKLQASLQNSKMTVLKNTGHFPFIEQSNRFIEELEHFLEEN